MKILIIEDDPQKAERVHAAVVEIFKPESVDVCRSYQSGRRYLQDRVVDLVVLDMSLPTFDPVPNQRQGRPRPLGGYELMRKLRRSGRKAKVVVLTALENFGSAFEQFTFEQLRQRCADEFPENFVKAIYYSQSKSSWKTELASCLEDLSCQKS